MSMYVVGIMSSGIISSGIISSGRRVDTSNHGHLESWTPRILYLGLSPSYNLVRFIPIP